MLGNWQNYLQRDVHDESLLCFGYGDGGGGPTDEMIEVGTRLANLPGMPKVTFDKAEAFFDRLAPRGEQLPVWNGELYLAPTGGGEVLMSALFDYRDFTPDAMTRMLHSIPALRERTHRIEFTTPILASAPLGAFVPRIVDEAERLLLVGDAAGAPDPIVGDGLALAFSSTEDAASAIVSGDWRSYQRRRLARGAKARRLGRLMLELSRTERRGAWFLRHCSAIVPRLLDLAVARESSPDRSA